MNTQYRKLSHSLLIAFLVFLVGLGQVHAQTPAFPDPIVDDNGHYGFVREVVPLLLGRKPRGSREVKLLGDIADITSRSTVLRLLMSTEEFSHYWADSFLDVLRLQRSGLKRQRSECFENPKQWPVPNSLAQFVASSNAELQWSGGDFNMKDVAISAFQADRIEALQRAYLYPFTMNGGRNYNEEVYKASQGEDFAHNYLNRNMRCFTCHNEVTSTSDAHTNWDRHWPIEIWSDKVLFGSSVPGDAGKLDNVFRFDQSSSDAADAQFFPWGIDENCAHDTYHGTRKGFKAVIADNAHDVDFAGQSGTDIGIHKVDEVLRDGIASIKTNGLILTGGGNNAFPEPTTAEQALAWTVAVSTVNLVWDKLMGEHLTVTNYFPRNPAQRDALWNLSLDTFIQNWSVKALLETILLSNYTARRTPELSASTNAYELPMIINPWVARDPRGSNPPPLTDLNSKNGQGEIVRAHSKRSAMRQASSALDVGMPTLFGSGRYSADTQLEFGQFLSTSQPGLEGFDIQSLLAWEDTNGLCQGSPWMNKLMTKIAQYDSQNPLVPLTLLDIVKTMRDWLLQDARIEISGSMQPASHELAALGAIFATSPGGTPLPLNTPAQTYLQLTAAGQLRTRLDEICGAYVSSPQFLMTGISLSQPLEIPDFTVCNGADDSCEYQPMCEDYEELLSSRLSVYIDCNGDSVVPDDPPPDNTPDITLCDFHPQICEDRFIPECMLDPLDLVFGGELACPTDIERCDPRCGGFDAGIGGGRFEFGLDGGFPGGGELGLRCCGGRPPIDRWNPDSVISWLEGALILEARDATVINLYDLNPRILTADQKLRFGDVISLAPGARLIVQMDGSKIDIGGRDGVPSLFSRSNSQAVQKQLTRLMDSGDNRVLRKMLAQGLNPNTILPGGESLLTWSIRRGDNRLSAELIDAGADLNRIDGLGNSPMTTAHQFRRRSVVSSLLRAGALPQNRASKYREKPLPHQIMVTGPSAAKAPHPAGDRYFSEAQRLDLRVEPKPVALEQQLRQILQARETKLKRFERARKDQPDDQDVITEFPFPSEER